MSKDVERRLIGSQAGAGAAGGGITIAQGFAYVDYARPCVQRQDLDAAHAAQFSMSAPAARLYALRA